jgi:YVTN family beta-propeller protein
MPRPYRLSILSAVAFYRLVAVAFALFLMHALSGPGFGQGTAQVGPNAYGEHLVPTGQLVRPAGATITFSGRPVDLTLSPDGRRLYVKDNRGLVVLDAQTWRLLQELPFPKEKTGGSMHGLAVRRDGKRVYVTTAQQTLHEAEVLDEGTLAWRRSLFLPSPHGNDDAHATGIALSADGKRAYVCLSRNNSVGIVDLEGGKLVQEVPVGVAPFAVVLTRDETRAYVSNWGGRRPTKDERTAPSSGTPTLVDERGIASSGTVAAIDLGRGKVVAEVAVGLHPAGLAFDCEEFLLYVANANSDTVTVIDTQAMRVQHTVLVRPDLHLPFGSGTNALALSSDGRTLFAANAGNNAVAVLALGERRATPVVRGFIPTGWYPGAVRADGKHLYIANVKGDGSQGKQPDKDGWHVTWHRGSVTRVPIPAPEQLSRYTAQVRADARVPQMLMALARAQSDRKPVPVPLRLGDPSVFEHVVYVIKENRTYDQLFGDTKEGNGDRKLCIYGEGITPNHHALARQFVLLDNYYCNGVVVRGRARLGYRGPCDGPPGEILWRVHPQLHLGGRSAELFVFRLSLGQCLAERLDVPQLRRNGLR